MDLPTCPSCGQSVLDDDVDNCPFCGASMSGPPSKPARPKPPSRPSPKSSKPAPEPTRGATSTAGRSAAASKPSAPAAGASKRSAAAEADDPFAVDAAAAQNAVKLLPRPAKGRTHVVVCPMCETPGYTSRAAAGKEVRCANSECLVPLFTAPKLEEPKAVDAPPQRAPSATVLTMGAAAGVLVAGFLVWFFVIRESPPAPGPAPGSSPVAGAERERDSSLPEAAPRFVRETPKERTPAELVKETLEKMTVITRSEQARNRRPYLLRLTAEAFAVAGDVGSSDQLTQLAATRQSVPFYQIAPLAIAAWNELESGRDDAAREMLERAWELAPEIPDRGRDAWEAAVSLAALGLVLGRGDEAADVVRNRMRDEERLAAPLWADLRAIREFEMWDLDEFVDFRVGHWTSPHLVAVTTSLAARGRFDEALRWAERQTDAQARVECTAAWADALAVRSSNWPGDALAKIEAAAAELPSEGRPQVLARAAAARLSRGDNAGADLLAAQAREALESLDVPPPAVAGGIVEIHNLNLPDRAPLRMAALGAAGVARVEAARGQGEAAWDALARGLDFLRAAAPAPSDTRRRLAEARDTAGSVLQGTLQQELNLDAARARTAMFRYQRNLAALNDAAEERFALQTALLVQATDWGLRDQVWDEVRSRAEHPDVAEREPYYRTGVLWTLAEAFRAADATDKASDVEGKLSSRQPPAGSVEGLRLVTSRALAAGDVARAAVAINNASGEPAERQRRALEIAGRLGRQGLEPAFDFARALRDPLLREESMELLAARASRQGEAQDVWTHIQSDSLPVADRIALARGFIAGVKLP